MTCICSEAQLFHVGCDCPASLDAVIVSVFVRGYASDDKAQVYVEGGVDPVAEVRRQYPYGTIYHTRRVHNPPRKIEQFSDEYIREMSKGG